MNRNFSSKMTAKNSKKFEPALAYLAVYNTTQAVGWTYLLLRSLVYFLNRGTLDHFWEEIKYQVIIFQNAAALEVLHAFAGIVSSGIFHTLTQVISRVFLVCGVLLVSDDATTSPGLVLCIFAWSVTEIIRYSYYAVKTAVKVPLTLLYLRYSMFYLLYPLGVTGELLCIYDSLNEVVAREYWAIPVLTDIVTLGPIYHAIFSVFYYNLLVFGIVVYIPMFPMLFSHMLRQRKKMLPKYLMAF